MTELRDSPELKKLLDQIQINSHLEIPVTAMGACRDLSLQTQLRLYAISWVLPGDKEWTLLLILKAGAGEQRRCSITLRVSDQTELLAEESLLEQSSQDFIFSQVAGTYEDKFLATISLSTGETQTLPPFEFSM